LCALCFLAALFLKNINKNIKKIRTIGDNKIKPENNSIGTTTLGVSKITKIMPSIIGNLRSWYLFIKLTLFVSTRIYRFWHPGGVVSINK
jgi:hypothetical protein